MTWTRTIAPRTSQSPLNPCARPPMRKLQMAHNPCGRRWTHEGRAPQRREGVEGRQEPIVSGHQPGHSRIAAVRRRGVPLWARSAGVSHALSIRESSWAKSYTRPAGALFMRIILVVLGVLVALAGAVWALQGAGFILGSFMSNDPTWIWIGAVTAL